MIELSLEDLKFRVRRISVSADTYQHYPQRGNTLYSDHDSLVGCSTVFLLTQS